MATTHPTDHVDVDVDDAAGLWGRLAEGSRMSEEAFEAWSLGREGLRAEWVDGEVVTMSPVSLKHADLVGFLGAVLRAYVEHHDLGRVLGPEFMTRVRAGDHLARRVPDLLFLARDRLGLLRPTYLDGPPDLVVEVVSPDSAARDWRQKYLEYQAAGVREYWVIDPSNRVVELSRLEGAGFLRVPEAEGRLASTVLPGLWLRPAWLWQDPLPRVREVLGELGVN